MLLRTDIHSRGARETAERVLSCSPALAGLTGRARSLGYDDRDSAGESPYEDTSDIGGFMCYIVFKNLLVFHRYVAARATLTRP